MQEQKFDHWNKIKKEIDGESKDKKVSIGKIYWCNVGKNIGREIYGKGDRFVRPVLVLNLFPNGMFLGVPLSSQTKNKTGFMFYKFKDSKQNTQVALLGQIRIFNTKRKVTYMSLVNDETLKEIKNQIKKEIIR